MGYDIDSEGYRPKRSKIDAVLALEPPKSLKQLRSFMGILNHLQRFLPNLQVFSDQLRPSLKASNKSKFEWGEDQQSAFVNILQLIANITKMFHYDQNRNNRVKCDACHSGLGAALEQEVEGDVWVPIAFASRFLNDQEKKFSTNELELLAIVWSCEYFRNYLLGNHFVVLTDHKAIISALKSNRGNKTHQKRLTRWADRLLPFDFDIFHISGCKLGIVDYLSRFPTFEAPRPSSFDEQYVVKCISRFFDACDFLDCWVRDCSLSEDLSDGLSAMSGDNQVPTLSASINSIESVSYCQPRAFCPIQDNSLDLAPYSSKDNGIQSAESVNNLDIQVTSQRTKSLEGDCSFNFGYTELFNEFNSVVTSPLEGVRINCQNSIQSALSWLNSLIVTFTACVPNYLPLLSVPNYLPICQLSANL